MKKILLSIIFALICTLASAESSVWQAQKDSSVIYIGGTCHLLRKTDFPLPPEFDKAYKASDVLVFETDIGKIDDPETQQKILLKGMYADGTTIDKHISSETFSMLSKYCASNGVPIDAVKKFKPAIIVITLTTMELMKLGVNSEGVDKFFYKLAVKDKKEVKKFETIDEQIGFILSMGKGNEDAFITHSISEMKNTKKDYEALMDAWKKGDTEKLYKLMVSGLKTKTPELYKTLLTDRNENWLPIIDTYFKTPEKEFILVGAGHLAGPDGIIEALKKKGCKVTQLKSETKASTRK
jgi:uncharacterized protein YbaP (TraB family)